MEEEIRKTIFKLADEEYKKFQANLCPGITNIVGVRIPILRSYAKELVKGDFRKCLRENGNTYYEEVMLQGMLIGIAKMECEERLEYLKTFIPKIDNWAVCDITCGDLKFVSKNKERVWNFLQTYLTSKKEFEVRFGVVMLLDYYITQEDIHLVLNRLDAIKHEGYYVKMAVAWTISLAYIRYPEITRKYLENNTLDNFTYNKSLQKIIESNRISKEEKEEIKKRKRK